METTTKLLNALSIPHAFWDGFIRVAPSFFTRLKDQPVEKIVYLNDDTAKAYERWTKLADKGYGERCNTPDQMNVIDERIRKAKNRYETLVKRDREQRQ